MTPPVVLDSQTSASYMLQQASCAAHVLVNRTGIPKDAWEDLRQEFVLDCLQRAPGFDPSRGEWRAFVRRLMRNRSGVAAHREWKRAQSEDVTQSRDGSDPNQPDILDLATAPREPASDDPTVSLVLSADMQVLIARLPDNLRNLALDLTYLTPVQVAAKTKRSPQRIHQLMARLRVAVVDAGILPKGFLTGGVR